MVKHPLRSRRGASSAGCLVSLLVLVGALYYGVNIGELFFRYYRLLDEMQTQAQLAPSLDDGTIRRRIQAAARSEEHTSELQSPCNLVCRLLLQKQRTNNAMHADIVTALTSSGGPA